MKAVIEIKKMKIFRKSHRVMLQKISENTREYRYHTKIRNFADFFRRTYVMCFTIWYHFYNSKNVKSSHGKTTSEYVFLAWYHPFNTYAKFLKKGTQLCVKGVDKCCFRKILCTCKMGNLYCHLFFDNQENKKKVSKECFREFMKASLAGRGLMGQIFFVRCKCIHIFTRR